MTDITLTTPVLKRKYFSFEERKRLERLRTQGVGVRESARILQRSHSTILRELARAPVYDRYRAEYAQRDFLSAQRSKGNIGKLVSNTHLRSAVIEGILKDSSPEQISNRIARMGEAFGVRGCVSAETIYQFLYRDPLAQKQKLYLHLRRSRTHRRRTKGRRSASILSRIARRESIHSRPVYIEHRREFGHLETDSVIFATGRDILSVQYERMMSLARLTKLPDKTAASTASALRWVVREFEHSLTPIRSVTYDNGTENVLHSELIDEYGITTYFADPYCSWQKGGVENLNGLIRQYLPRNTDFKNLSHERLYEIQELLNNRPRKRLNWLTPNEAYAGLTNPYFSIISLF